MHVWQNWFSQMPISLKGTIPNYKEHENNWKLHYSMDIFREKKFKSKPLLKFKYSLNWISPKNDNILSKHKPKENKEYKSQTQLKISPYGTVI